MHIEQALGAPVTEKDILCFEEQYPQFILPEDYRQFLLHTNGGDPEETLFDMRDDAGNEDTGCVRRFLCLGKSADSLESYLHTYRDRLPVNCLPVAYDDGGNLICLLFEGENVPVVFWDHEQEGWDSETPCFFSMIATTFTQFCNALYTAHW